jgi:hypothetical protein
MYKFLLKLTSMWFLLMNFSISFAQINTVEIVEKLENESDLTQIKLDNSKLHLAVISHDKKSMINFFDQKNIKKRILQNDFIEESGAMVVLRPSLTTDLIFSLHLKGWLVTKITSNKLNFKQQIIKELGNINSVIKTKEGYLLGGDGLGESNSRAKSVPLMIELNEELIELKRLYNKKSDPGEIRLLQENEEYITAIINTNYISKLVKLSKDFLIKNEIILNGYASTGISTGGDFFVTYVDRENYLWVEKINKNMQRLWKTKILLLAGENAPQFLLLQVKNGFAIVGTNDGSLVVAGISSNGALANTFLDKQSFENSSDIEYISMSDENNINLFFEISGSEKYLRCSNSKNCKYRIHKQVNINNLLLVK